MIRILGIDPGSRKTGYGLIESENQRDNYLTAGVIELKSDSLAERLNNIYNSIQSLVVQFKPDHVAVEKVFMNKNADSALKLGHARGAAICAATTADNDLFEYSARQVKLAVVGTGAADKAQVQHMVRVILSLQIKLREDAADALAVAVCHGHTWINQQKQGAGSNAAGLSRFRK